MGGRQIQSTGSGDDGFDEEGYDESQRAEILEFERDGPGNGVVLTDMKPDLGEDPDLLDDENDGLSVLGDDEDAEEDEGADDEAAIESNDVGDAGATIRPDASQR